MNDFNIATADRDALKAYAKNNYDLSLTLNMNEDTMREKILSHCRKNNLELPTYEILGKQDTADKRAGKKVRTLTVNIPKSEKPGGNEPVFIGFQGVGYLVPRGMNVVVSPGIVEILNNAITDNVTQDEDGEMVHNETPTYPFSVTDQAA